MAHDVELTEGINEGVAKVGDAIKESAKEVGDKIKDITGQS